MHASMLEVTCSGIPSYEQVAGTLPLAQCVWKVIPGILFLHTLWTSSYFCILIGNLEGGRLPSLATFFSEGRLNIALSQETLFGI